MFLITTNQNIKLIFKYFTIFRPVIYCKIGTFLLYDPISDNRPQDNLGQNMVYIPQTFFDPYLQIGTLIKFFRSNPPPFKPIPI